MSTIRVQTAQNVSLEYEVASLGDRIVAGLLDYLVLGAWAVLCFVVMALFLAKNGAGNSLRGQPLIIALLILGYAPFVFYHVLCEVFFNGQSIGKKARDIKVMRLDGTSPRLGDYLLRWLLGIVDMQFGGLVAIITIAANGRGQRVGDLAAGTTVIKARPRHAGAVPLPGLAALANYQVVFPQAALLADHDVALVRQLVHQASSRQNYTVLNEIANKVKALTGIETSLQDGPFLQTVLRDHAHLAAVGSN